MHHNFTEFTLVGKVHFKFMEARIEKYNVENNPGKIG